MQSEAYRFERLRAQDGKPLVPPPHVRGLTSRGGLDPAKLQEARQQWDSAKVASATAPSYPTEERLFWTTFLLVRHYAEHDARPAAQQLIDASLPLVQDPRHQQILLGLGGRNAAALGDVNLAQQFTARLDACSEDLQVDTNYRFSVAYVAATSGDAQAILAVLGSQIDDVPISDAYDEVCGVLRAHAHELLGQDAIAQEQLAQLAGSPDRLALVEEIARSNRALQLVPRSLPVVGERMRQVYSNVVVTRSGINLRGIFLIAILAAPLALGVEWLSTSLQPPLSSILPGVLIGALVLGSVVFSLSLVLKGPRTRRRLAQTGVAGTGQLLAVEQTNTRVNDQPMLKLRMLIQLADRAPYVALHQEVVPEIRLSQLRPGASLPVRVDKDDAAVMAIAWS